MRILFHSNAPWAGTGYGQQTALWVPRIASLGHEVVISAFFGMTGSATEWQGFPVLPVGQDLYGADILPAHARAVKADLVITLMDAFVLDPAQVAGLRAVHWLPVDCSPLSALDRNFLARSGTEVIAVTEFGDRVLTEAGFTPLAVIPHGTDLGIYRPADDRDAVRQALGTGGRYVIGMNAANKEAPVCRKAFTEHLLAFARFRQRHPDALLLIHSVIAAPGALDMRPLIADLGLDGSAVKFSDAYQYLAGLVRPSDLAAWYSALDLYAGASYAEGFGLGILEAAACGTPAVVTDCSAMSEVCEAGWKVGGEPWWHSGHQAWWRRPSVSEIEQAFEDAYAIRGTPEAAAMSARARESAARYDADRILAERWKPLLETLEAGTDPGGR